MFKEAPQTNVLFKLSPTVTKGQERGQSEGKTCGKGRRVDALSCKPRGRPLSAPSQTGTHLIVILKALK